MNIPKIISFRLGNSRRRRRKQKEMLLKNTTGIKKVLGNKSITSMIEYIYFCIFKFITVFKFVTIILEIIFIKKHEIYILIYYV